MLRGRDESLPGENPSFHGSWPAAVSAGVFAVGPNLPSPFLQSPAFAGKAGKGSPHFTLVRPFSWGREHWCVITKKPVCPSCPQMPPRSSGVRSMPPHGGQFRLTFKSVLVTWRVTPPSPPPLEQLPLLVSTAVPGAHLKSDCSGQMESRPKVRSSSDTTWMLIRTM